MSQANGFHQVFISTQGAGDGPADLGYFQSMGQPGTIIITFIINEYLGLIFQSAECGRMDDTIPVTSGNRSDKPVLLPGYLRPFESLL